jgi:hypothetical protein
MLGPLGPRWRRWPCTRACTAFFRIPYTAVIGHVPPQLGIVVDHDGWSQIELGYVRFRAGPTGACDELAWAIRVERTRGLGDAWLAMNIAASTEEFLARQDEVGFVTCRPPAAFDASGDGATIAISVAGAPVCVLRDQQHGRLPLPFYPLTSEVWTARPGSDVLARRLFRWRGAANVVLAPNVAWTLFPHAFFRGVDVTRAEPLPTRVLTSDLVVDAEQHFTDPVPVV